MSRFFISLFAYSRELDNRDRESMAEQRAVEKDATLYCVKIKSGTAGRPTLRAAPNDPARSAGCPPFVGICRFVS